MEIRSRKHRSPNHRSRRYIAIALCIALFVVLNMAIIFSFSAESREESGDRSASLAAIVLRIVYPDYDQLSSVEKVEAMETVHHLVRKAAHFLEYALLGFLTSSLMLFLRRYLVKRKIEPWKTWFYPAEFCFLYAITDEVHQVYSERGPSPKDVLIDTAGALCGILLIQLIVLTVRALRKGKKGGTAPKAAVAHSTEEAGASDREAVDTAASDGSVPDEDGSAEGEVEVAPCALPPTD